jgi:hypothetical protein
MCVCARACAKHVYNNLIHSNKELISIDYKSLSIGWVKLTSEGVWKHDGRAGFGEIIRGNDVEWLGVRF